MNTEMILSFVKARLGITAAVRDIYLTAIIKGVIDELEKQKGIALDSEDYCHLMFIVDYSVWKYQSRDSPNAMPRHLQFRLNNLFVHNGGLNNDVRQ